MKSNWFNWLSLAHFIHHFVNYQNFVSILSLDHSTQNFSIVRCGVLVGGCCVVVVKFFFLGSHNHKLWLCNSHNTGWGRIFHWLPCLCSDLAGQLPWSHVLFLFFIFDGSWSNDSQMYQGISWTSATSWESFDQKLGFVFLRLFK